MSNGSLSLPGSNGLSASDQRHAIAASLLGWTLDAFDFFVLTFLITPLSQQFHVSKSSIVLTLTMTLAMRPVGALLFGMLADRYGRRRPLMANVIFFSVVELLCGFAPNYTVFFALRTVFGIGMGGEWGVGASLAMESVSSRRRGVISGIIQSGYSAGYLLAAIAARIVLPMWGWRAMFWAGGLPALLAFYIRYRVKESRAWEQHRAPTVGSILRTAFTHWKLLLYLAAMMALMNCLSHGTQDLYPDFLGSRGIRPSTVSYLAMLYNVGAILGGISFGHFSEIIGRRWGMLVALAVALAVIPLWAFSSQLALLAIGAFLMQVGVQGAWGIIPAHLNELSPDSVRGMLPGFAYQIGILFASPTNTIEYALRDHLGYSWALASFEIAVMLLLALTVLLGSEKRGKSFLQIPAQKVST